MNVYLWILFAIARAHQDPLSTFQSAFTEFVMDPSPSQELRIKTVRSFDVLAAAVRSTTMPADSDTQTHQESTSRRNLLTTSSNDQKGVLLHGSCSTNAGLWFPSGNLCEESQELRIDFVHTTATGDLLVQGAVQADQLLIGDVDVLTVLESFLVCSTEPNIVGMDSAASACANTPSGGDCVIQCTEVGYGASDVAQCISGAWTSTPTCDVCPAGTYAENSVCLPEPTNGQCPGATTLAGCTCNNGYTGDGTDTCVAAPWIKVLQYGSSAYTPTTAAVGDLNADPSVGFAKMSDADINALVYTNPDGYHYYKFTSNGAVSDNVVIVRVTVDYGDTTRGMWDGDREMCQGDVDIDQCTWYTIPGAGSRFETEGVDGNDCDRWFCDYSSNPNCYTTSSTTTRCFSVGYCTVALAMRPNVIIYKLVNT